MTPDNGPERPLHGEKRSLQPRKHPQDGLEGWFCVGCERPKPTGPNSAIRCAHCGHHSASTAPFSRLGEHPTPRPH